ncbi:hypothetical protein KPH14_000998 [Odynerus spinipes]|uniref:RNase H type-1 domain-containing protein n=1 Tax=Odynerus spinipes TaxID=1348599 RepID=A0AAD9VML2_9HYME|nr:hypothetical protein KPH14_000998 [Odynerus spinipes]
MSVAGRKFRVLKIQTKNLKRYFIIDILDCSVFTVKCYTISVALDLVASHRVKSFIICTNAVITIQAILKVTSDSKSNKLIMNIRRKIQRLKVDTDEAKVVILWIPAHKGIKGNTTKSVPLGTKEIPHTDVQKTFKDEMWEKVKKAWRIQGQTKGREYFLNYFKENRTSWFTSKELARKVVVWVSRARAHHSKP